MSVASSNSSPGKVMILDGATNGDLVAFPQTVSFKLDDSNFLIWRKQIESTVRGYGLFLFLEDGRAPPQFLSPEDLAAGTVSLDYLFWHQQDQLIFSWLQSTISGSMLPRLVDCSTSRDAWKCIEDFFNAHTRAKTIQYKKELRNTKKEARTISEFIMRVKFLANVLMSIGYPVTEEDQAEVILDGLPNEYDSIVSAVNSQRNPFSLNEIESLLMAHELKLAHSLKSANVMPSADQSSQAPRGRGGGCPGRQSRGRRRGGRGHGHQPTVLCQICLKSSHVTHLTLSLIILLALLIIPFHMRLT